MSKILVAYGSETGNTMNVAEWIAETLITDGHAAKMVDCLEIASPDGLCEPFDLIVFGSSTYGLDPCAVQDDFRPLLDGMDKAGVDGKRVALFGCGDATFPHFCGAVDLIAARVRQCGGALLGEPLRVADPHNHHEDAVRTWARDIARAA